MTNRLHAILTFVLCAALAALTFAPAAAQAQQKPVPSEAELRSQARASAMTLSNRTAPAQQSLVPGAVALGSDLFNDQIVSFPYDDVTDVTVVAEGSEGGAGDLENNNEGYVIVGTELYAFNASTGQETFVGDLATEFQFAGMDYDASSDTWYATTADFGSQTPAVGSLYTIDVENATATEVGELTGTTLLVDITSDDVGNLYGIDRDDDNLYEIDTSTGAATAVGPIGFDSNFDQGLDYDPLSGNAYFAAINAGAGNSPEVHIIDLDTGAATLAGTFAELRQITWFGSQDLVGAPNLVAESLDFGEVSTGETATETLTLTNTGVADLTVSDISLADDADGAFSVIDAPSTSFTLAPDETETVEVSFSPTMGGMIMGAIEVTSDDDGNDDTVTTVALEGEGIAPVAPPFSENFDDVTPPTLPVGWTIDNTNGDQYVWGSFEEADATSPPNVAQIRWNPSAAMDDWLFSAPLDLQGGTTYVLEFSYGVASGNFPENLEVTFGDAATPGAMQDPPLFSEEGLTNTTFETASASFTPDSDGTYHIGFHGFSEPDQFRLFVDDVSVTAQANDAEFAVTPDTVAFGDIFIGVSDSDSVTVEVSNDGGGTLTVEEPTITGPDADLFVIDDDEDDGDESDGDDNDFPVDLAGTESLDFNVELADDLMAGTYEATLNIPYDDGSGTQTAEVPITVTVINGNYGGGGENSGGYFYANSTENSQANAPSAPQVNDLTIPAGNETDVSDELDQDSAVGGPYEIGFDFDYFGQSYDSFCIADDGFISLINSGEACPGADFTNDPIPTSDTPNNMLAWYWDDLDVGALPETAISYGADDQGNLLVKFETVGFFSFTPDPEAFVSATVKLYDSGDDANDKVRYQYEEFGPAVDLGDATVGIENADGTAGLEYRFGDFNTEARGGPLQAEDGGPLAVEFGPDASSLPVELDAFTASTLDGEPQSVRLSWQTLSEDGNRGFQVQMKREVSGNATGAASQTEWQDAGDFVASRAPGGTSTEAQEYSLTLSDLEIGQYTFRLRQVDIDGDEVVAGEGVEATVGFEGAYSLSGAYPNPFRSRATFEVAVKEAQEVRVELYDVLGRKVRTLFDGELEAATPRAIDLDAGSLASGTYFYRVIGEGFTASEQIVLVR